MNFGKNLLERHLYHRELTWGPLPDRDYETFLEWNQEKPCTPT